MTTFHTNGRIVSAPGANVPNDPQVISSTSSNNIRSVYASKIISKNNPSVTNESTVSDQPQGRIDHISESVVLGTLQQPQQENNQVAFAAFGQKRTRNRSFPCTEDNKDQSHPENPCFICLFGEWVHYNTIKPSKCGTYIVEDNNCVRKDFALAPCTKCNDTNGVHPVCNICEKCDPTEDNPNRCVDICPEGYICLEEGCKKTCTNSSSDCRWEDCEVCNSRYVCEKTCGTGEICDFGICKGECWPPCNANNCETCEYKNGVYGCQGADPIKKYGYIEICCKGKKYSMYVDNKCKAWDPVFCVEYDNCPQNTVCRRDECLPFCSGDNDCNAACCEKCVQLDGDNFKTCVSCPDYGACLDGECKQNNENRGILEEINDIKKCNGCQKLEQKDTPECTAGNGIECYKSECFECKNYCAELSKTYNKPFECKEVSPGKFACRPYDIQITSINLLP